MAKTLIKIIIVVAIALLLLGFTKGLDSLEVKDKEIREYKERTSNLVKEVEDLYKYINEIEEYKEKLE